MRAQERRDLVSRVVDGAAEALTLDELGENALPPFRTLLGVGSLMLYRSTPERPFAFVAGLDSCLPEYTSRFVHDDPIQDVLRDENPVIFSGSRSRVWGAVRRRRALSDFYRRWELSWLLHVRLSAAAHMEPGYVAIVCGRCVGQRDFGEEELRSAAEVLPALAAAVRRAGRVGPRLSSAEACEALLGHARAVLALDLAGRQRWISARAEELLPRGPLPDALIAAARRLGAGAPGATKITLAGAGGACLEAELYLARAASGEPFVAVDLGAGGDVPMSLFDVARRHALTRSETEVLADLARGLSDSEIAARRFVSVPTVRTHVTRVLSKCGVRSRLQAVALALGTLRLPS